MRKLIAASLSILPVFSTIIPVVAQPVPIMALPFIANPVGLVLVGSVVVGGVVWYVYQDQHHHKFRSRVNNHTTPSRGMGNHMEEFGKGQIVYHDELVIDIEDCKDVARRYGEKFGGKWKVVGTRRVIIPGLPEHPHRYKCILKEVKE